MSDDKGGSPVFIKLVPRPDAAAIEPTIEHGELVVLEGSAPEPKARLRLSHDWLAKEGWRFDSTVELEYAPGQDGGHERALADLEMLVRRVGDIRAAERDRRPPLGVRP